MSEELNMPVNNSLAEKKFIRTRCLAAREKMDKHEANAAAMAFAHHLLEAIPATARVVAGYRAIRGEIDLAAALPELTEHGYQYCLPVIVAERAPLAFRLWQPGDGLEKGPHDTEVPLAMAPPVIPDTIIVPLVAFDGKGHRLGYGGGYYDITIRRLREAQKNIAILGAAFSSQQVEHIPLEPHDEVLDAVITEKTILRFK